METTSLPIALFRIGRICSTPSALETLSSDNILSGLQRHQAGNWGDVCDEDREANNQALKNGTRLFSVYHGANGIKFWIITEADWSVTTILLPEDY